MMHEQPQAQELPRVCPACGVAIRPGLNLCTSCGQVLTLPRGVRLASPGRRLAAYLRDGLIVILTLGLGALVWSLIVWNDGRTPGKQLLGLRVVDAVTGQPAGWGRMFLRIVVYQATVIGLVGMITFGIATLVGHMWLLWDQRRQNLYDKMASTLVVRWPGDLAA